MFWAEDLSWHTQEYINEERSDRFRPRNRDRSHERFIGIATDAKRGRNSLQARGYGLSSAGTQA